MATAVKYKKEIMNLTKDLPENELKELIDFAEFLKTKKEEAVFCRWETALQLSESLGQRKRKESRPERDSLKSLWNGKS